MCSSAYLPRVLILLRQRRVATSNGFVSSLGTAINYLRRTRNGAAGSSPGTTIKYLWQTTAANNRLATMIKYLRGAAGIGLGSTTKYRTQCLGMEPKLPPCVHKQNPHQHAFSFS
jgi:hypothetical protein